MIKVIQAWFNRYFSDPEAVLLIVLIGITLFLVLIMGHILAPIIISVIFAYLLDWIVRYLQKCRMPRLAAVWLVYVGFLAFFAVLFLVLLPLLWKQIATLLTDLPALINKARQPLDTLTHQFPEYFSESQMTAVLNSIIQTAKARGSMVLSASLSSIPGILTWLVYLVLIPLLVFFFLKDRSKIIQWITTFLPEKRGLVRSISNEINTQIGNYCWGKVIEIFVTWLVSYIIFSFLGLKYAMILTFVLGLSTLIPYIGVIVVTIPFSVVGYLQWGWGVELVYVMGTYFIIQGLLASLLNRFYFPKN